MFNKQTNYMLQKYKYNRKLGLVNRFYMVFNDCLIRFVLKMCVQNFNHLTCYLFLNEICGSSNELWSFCEDKKSIQTNAYMG